MTQPIGSYPHVLVRDDGRAVVPAAGSVLLVETVRKTGLVGVHSYVPSFVRMNRDSC
ncbi:hypothetical protein [Streptomyces niveus]|uniref:hypothetical protein n=1 Tax=Streptomyces niveus TaxID=193462 RepID=UPI0036D430EF